MGAVLSVWWPLKLSSLVRSVPATRELSSMGMPPGRCRRRDCIDRWLLKLSGLSLSGAVVAVQMMVVVAEVAASSSIL